jgi:hypothetical protein
MTSIAEDVRDAIHEELIGVAAALKPPDSNGSVKHAPDPVLISTLITQVLVPILTSVASGILTHLLTRGDDADTRRKLAEVDAKLKTLADRDKAVDSEAVDAIVHSIGNLPVDSATPGIVSEEDVAHQITAVLRRYHLSDATSARLAPLLVQRALAALSAASSSRR